VKKEENRGDTRGNKNRGEPKKNGEED